MGTTTERAKRAWRDVDPRLPPRLRRALGAGTARALRTVGRRTPVLPETPPGYLDELGTVPDPDDDRAECPICATRVERFDAAGARTRRPDQRCPTCGSLPRHRMVWLYLALRTDLLTEPARLLHVAPEAHLGVYLRRRPTLRYLSADLEPGKAMTVLDVTAIDRPDESFDAVYMSHVLEHVPDDQLAMRELRRVLRPGGQAIFMVPVWGPTTREDPSITDPAERTRLFGQHDHVRMYGHDGTVERRLEAAGFDVSVVAFAQELGEAVARRHRLDPREELYVATRPLA